jgi:hypothetical protein
MEVRAAPRRNPAAGVENDAALSPLITRFKPDGTIDNSFTRRDGLCYANTGEVDAVAEAADGAILFASKDFAVSKLWRDEAPAAQLHSATQRSTSRRWTSTIFRSPIAEARPSKRISSRAHRRRGERFA